MAAQTISRTEILRRQLDGLPVDMRERAETIANAIGITDGDIYLGHTFDEQLTKLAFDVQKGHWIFTEALKVNVAKITLKEMSKWTVIGVGGGAVLGSVLVFVRYKATGDITFEEFGRDLRQGAITGAALGLLWGAWNGAYSVHYRVEHLKAEIDTQHQRIDKAAQEILKTLFNVCTGEGVEILCSLSGKIFHVPVETRCHLEQNEHGEFVETDSPHTFEYAFLASWLDGSPTCPKCNKDVSLMDLNLAVNKRQQVSEIVLKTLTWLASQQSDESIDALDQRFLENPQRIVQQIKTYALEGAELAFLTHLVREKVQDYNQRVLDVYSSILEDISKNTRKLGEDEALRLHIQLNNWTKAFKIPLPEIQEPAPRDGPEIVEV